MLATVIPIAMVAVALVLLWVSGPVCFTRSRRSALVSKKEPSEPLVSRKGLLSAKISLVALLWNQSSLQPLAPRFQLSFHTCHQFHRFLYQRSMTLVQRSVAGSTADSGLIAEKSPALDCCWSSRAIFARRFQLRVSMMRTTALINCSSALQLQRRLLLL